MVQICLFILLEKEKIREIYRDNGKLIICLSIIVLIGLIVFVTIENPLMLAVTKKLGRNGGVFGSARFVAQRKALTQLFLYPMGGRHMDLGRIAYAHNTWLDMANTAGLIPFFAFVAYTLYSAYELLKWIIQKDISTERKLITAGMYVAFFLYYMVERGIEGSIHFMTPWFFINGMVHGELSMIKKSKLEC